MPGVVACDSHLNLGYRLRLRSLRECPALLLRPCLPSTAPPSTAPPSAEYPFFSAQFLVKHSSSFVPGLPRLCFQSRLTMYVASSRSRVSFTWFSALESELHKQGHMTTGNRLFCKEFLCFNIMPCRHMP